MTKEEIIKLLGKKQGRTYELTSTSEYEDPSGIYIWRGNVCILMGGNDVLLEELSEHHKEYVFSEVEKGNYKINNTLQ